MIRIRQLLRDVRGTALVEFAIVLPVLLILFLGGYQLSDAITCKRKVTIMTRAVGDMTSQYRSLTTGELDALLTASTQILAPYPVAPSQLRVSQVTVGKDGMTVRVDWSRAHNAWALYPAEYPASSLPEAYRQPNMVFIYVEASYTYDNGLASLFGPVTFSQELWLLPRRSSTITLS